MREHAGIAAALLCVIALVLILRVCLAAETEQPMPAQTADVEKKAIWAARRLEFDGMWRAAEREYDRILKEDLGNREARAGRARALAGSGRLTEAIPEFESLVKESPNYESSYLPLARAYAMQGKLKDESRVLAGFMKVLKNDDYYLRGRLLELSGKPDEAEGMLKSAVQGEGPKRRAYMLFDLGQFCQRRGRFAEAVSQYAEAATLIEQGNLGYEGDTLLQRGLCEFAIGKHKEAWDSLSAVVRRLRATPYRGNLSDKQDLYISLVHLHLLSEVYGVGQSSEIEEFLSKEADGYWTIFSEQLGADSKSYVGEATDFGTVLLLLYGGKADPRKAEEYFSQWRTEAPFSQEAQLGTYFVTCWHYVKAKELLPDTVPKDLPERLQKGLADALQKIQPTFAY